MRRGGRGQGQGQAWSRVAYVHGFAPGEPEHDVQDEGGHEVEEYLAQSVHHAVGAEREARVPLQVLGRRGQRVVLAQVAQLFPSQRIQRARRAVVHPDGVLPETCERVILLCAHVTVRINVLSFIYFINNIGI